MHGLNPFEQPDAFFAKGHPQRGLHVPVVFIAPHGGHPPAKPFHFLTKSLQHSPPPRPDGEQVRKVLGYFHHNSLKFQDIVILNLYGAFEDFLGHFAGNLL